MTAGSGMAGPHYAHERRFAPVVALEIPTRPTAVPESRSMFAMHASAALVPAKMAVRFNTRTVSTGQPRGAMQVIAVSRLSPAPLRPLRTHHHAKRIASAA